MSGENIQAVVRLVRGAIVVEECGYFEDTANVNVLLQRLGADANRRFRPQMLLAKEREERELQERMRQEEQASNAVLPNTPQIFASAPPTIQAVHSMGEASHLFQHVNTHLDRLCFVMQEMNSRLCALETRNEDTQESVNTGSNNAVLKQKFAEVQQRLQSHHPQTHLAALNSIRVEGGV
jgi:hypothetical protein